MLLYILPFQLVGKSGGEKVVFVDRQAEEKEAYRF